MSTPTKDPLMQVETTCGSLLHELQIGEPDIERDKMLLELERECLEVYSTKVDLANKSRAQIRQAIADCEAELATICSAMGERPVHIRQSDESSRSLKAELRAILPELEEMKKMKSERKNQFIEVLEQIQKIQMAQDLNRERMVSHDIYPYLRMEDYNQYPKKIYKSDAEHKGQHHRGSEPDIERDKMPLELERNSCDHP